MRNAGALMLAAHLRCAAGATSYLWTAAGSRRAFRGNWTHRLGRAQSLAQGCAQQRDVSGDLVAWGLQDHRRLRVPDGAQQFLPIGRALA